MLALLLYWVKKISVSATTLKDQPNLCLNDKNFTVEFNENAAIVEI